MQEGKKIVVLYDLSEDTYVSQIIIEVEGKSRVISNKFLKGDIDKDLKARQNWLRFTKRRPTEKDGGVLSLLASVKGCLTYFQNGARNLSFNYKHHKDEDKRPGDDDYTLENAIESVLTEFHLSREQIRYLKPIIMGGQVKSKKDKKDTEINPKATETNLSTTKNLFTNL